jgi:hypothetical protein
VTATAPATDARNRHATCCFIFTELGSCQFAGLSRIARTNRSGRDLSGTGTAVVDV